MRNLVPLTKILLTLGTAVWAIIFREPFSLALLCVLELIILLVSNELFKNESFNDALRFCVLFGTD